MTKQTKQGKSSRRRHNQQFKTEALALAERVGVPEAARQLGLHESQLYGWRSRARLGGGLRVSSIVSREKLRVYHRIGADGGKARIEKGQFPNGNWPFSLMGGTPGPGYQDAKIDPLISKTVGIPPRRTRRSFARPAKEGPEKGKVS